MKRKRLSCNDKRYLCTVLQRGVSEEHLHPFALYAMAWYSGMDSIMALALGVDRGIACPSNSQAM